MYILGESGLGKSTLVRSLFLTNLFGNKTCPPAVGKLELLHFYHLMIFKSPASLSLSLSLSSSSLSLSDRIKPTPSIDATTVDIEEKGVKLRLTVVDTPGFGDAVDNREW